MASSRLLLFLFALSFFSLSSSMPQETIRQASDILFDTGYISMAINLQIVSQTVLSNFSSLTIFAPFDSVFRKSHQPSLDLLQFHFTPLPLPPQSLSFLPSGFKIPTMLANHSLIVTTSPSDHEISLNNVTINKAPIYVDGFYLIYGVDKFFDPNFQFKAPLIQRRCPNPACGLRNQTVNPSCSFAEVIKMLRSGGYYEMAKFLGWQPSGVTNQTAMTVLAPEDDLVEGHFNKHQSAFLRHVFEGVLD